MIRVPRNQNDRRHLRGSKSRDDFKYWHKQDPIPRNFYALDLDFIFVEKYPPRIVAILDYKRPGDTITFAECIAFNDLIQHYPVYIVESESPFENFEIYQYVGGNWRPFPPEVELQHIASLRGVDEFIEWERTLRKNTRT